MDCHKGDKPQWQAQQRSASSINYDNYFASRAETRQQNNEPRRKVQGNVREYVWIIAFYEAEHDIKTAKMDMGCTWGKISAKKMSIYLKTKKDNKSFPNI